MLFNQYFKAGSGLLVLATLVLIFTACNKEEITPEIPAPTDEIENVQPLQQNSETISATELEDLQIGTSGIQDTDSEIAEFGGSCNLTFNYNQVYTCCGDNTCSCVDLTVQGIYNYSCMGSLQDIWFSSMFMCSQGNWSGVSPTIRIRLNSSSACQTIGDGSCQYIGIPVTMHYSYNCGFGTCYGSYTKTVQMLLC